MSNRPLQLSVAVYSEAAVGQANFDHLQALWKARIVNLTDIAMVERTNGGELRVSATSKTSPSKGARRGLVAGAIIGIMFPPGLIVSTAAGAAAGGAIAKFRKPELTDSPLRSIGDDLEPGQSAVIIVAEDDSTPQAIERLSGHLRVHQHAIDESSLA